MARIYVPSTGECGFLDDIDFVGEARTIRFSLDGIHYEVDLSDANFRKLRDLLQPFISVSHIVRRDDKRHEEQGNLASLL
jgi:Lsr2